MENAYLYDSLISLMYKELNADQLLETLELFRIDSDLFAEYLELRAAKAQLPQVLFEPAESSVRAIMQYSARTAA